MTRVVDVFPFFNELDLLELRLETLESSVDLFVISEATTTFSGKKKPLYLTENLSRYKRWSDRIIVNVIDIPPTADAFANDRAQKNSIKQALESLCEEEDFVLFSDADEIPRPDALLVGLEIARRGKLAHFAQDLFYYYLNLRESSGRLLSASGDYPGIAKPAWLGTRGLLWKSLGSLELDDLRQPRSLTLGERVANGGWHFSFVGSDGLSVEDRVRKKIEAYAHQEFNNFRYKWQVGRRIRRGDDILLRDSRFEICPISDLPAPVAGNPAAYRELLAPDDLVHRLSRTLR